MKIKISEVWNYEGRSAELAIIETSGDPRRAVWDWIEANRPELMIAGINDHGFHAKEAN